MTTIAVFGGSQEKTLQKIGTKYGCTVLHHSAKSRNGGNKKEFKNNIKKADIVVVLYGACGHVAMDCIKENFKKMNKRLVFHKGFGASGAIQKCVEKLEMEMAA